MKFAGRILVLMLICCGVFACSRMPVTGNKPEPIVQVFLAGDSTMAIKDPKDYPETGWGVPFATFFNNSVKVINLAKNGRSTRTFIGEGRWQALLDALHPNDFVFIQFGHNDEVKTKVDRYTTPEQYRENLRRFVNDVEDKQAHAVLLTPVVRRHFNVHGKLENTHPYADIVRVVAREHKKVVFLDMEKITHRYFEALGAEDSKLRFMHLDPGLHPNYPDGVEDNTHYNELGAREVAQLALLELRRIDHPLSKLLRNADPGNMRK